MSHLSSEAQQLDELRHRLNQFQLANRDLLAASRLWKERHGASERARLPIKRRVNELESELKSVKAERDRLASQLDAVRRAIDPAPGSSTQSSEPVAHGAFTPPSPAPSVNGDVSAPPDKPMTEIPFVSTTEAHAEARTQDVCQIDAAPSAVSSPAVHAFPIAPLVKVDPPADDPEPLLPAFSPSSPPVTSPPTVRPPVSPASAQAPSQPMRPTDPRRRPSDAVVLTSISKFSPIAALEQPSGLSSPPQPTLPCRPVPSGDAPLTSKSEQELLFQLSSLIHYQPTPTLGSRVFQATSPEEEEAYRLFLSVARLPCWHIFGLGKYRCPDVGCPQHHLGPTLTPAQHVVLAFLYGIPANSDASVAPVLAASADPVRPATTSQLERSVSANSSQPLRSVSDSAVIDARRSSALFHNRAPSSFGGQALLGGGKRSASASALVKPGETEAKRRKV